MKSLMVLLVLVASLGVGACQRQDLVTHKTDDIKPGPGLLSGPKGSYEIKL